MTRREGDEGLALSALLFGLPLLAVAIWIFISMGLGPILEWRASRSWTATPCQIIEMKTVWNDDETFATVTPRYEYIVDGRSYEGDRYDFGNHRFDRDEVTELTSWFPSRSQATCYVDPEDGSESVLSQEYNGNYTGGCVFGGILLAIGLALTWVGFRWRSTPMSVRASLMSSGG